MFGIKKNTKNATTTTGFKGKSRKLVLALGGIGLAGILIGTAPAMARDRVEVRVGPGIVVGFHHHHRIWIPGHYQLQTVYVDGCPVTQQVFVPGHFVWR